MTVTLVFTPEDFVADEGTVLVFESHRADDDRIVAWACDRRPGLALLAYGPTEVEVEPWQILCAEPVPA